eukprot:scaffold288895_cov16-Tisochrysis_lutea.AAC.1
MARPQWVTDDDSQAACAGPATPGVTYVSSKAILGVTSVICAEGYAEACSACALLFNGMRCMLEPTPQECEACKECVVCCRAPSMECIFSGSP